MIHPITVALVGQNALVREGLRRILIEYDYHVTCSVDRASLAIRAEGPPPQLAVVDAINGAQAIEQLRQLRRDMPDTRQVVLVDQFAFEDMASCFRAGADGYIVKEISCEPLIASLRLAAMGEKVMPSQLADALPCADQHPASIEVAPVLGTANLSEREAEILSCLVQGYPNKVISRHLRISEATVKVHVKAVLRKLRVQNRTQAAIWGVAHGFDCANDDDRLTVAPMVAKMPMGSSATAVAVHIGGATLPIGSSPLSAARLPGRYSGPIQSGPPIALATRGSDSADVHWADNIVANEIDDDQLAFVAAGFDEQPMFVRRPKAVG